MIRNVVRVSAAQLTVPVSAEAVTLVRRNPRLTVVKTAEPRTATRLGETIAYRVNVLNAGNTRLTALVVVDALVPMSACAPIAQGGTLLPGQNTVCTGSHVISQADLDAQVPLVNTVTVDSAETAPVQAMATVNVVHAAALEVDKQASVGEVSRAGTQIRYTITARNGGNAVLHNVRVTDPTLTGALDCAPVAQGGELQPGQSTVCTAVYTVSQSDMNAGAALVNVASVETSEAGPVRAMATVAVVQQPSFTVQKQADRVSVNATGQRITYTVRVENTGNVDLTSVNVRDRMLGLTLQCNGGSGSEIAVLPTGQSATCTGFYIVTQRDMNAGSALVNVVSVNANEFGPVTARVTVAVDQVRTLRASKFANVTSVSAAGQRILYTVQASNTGTVDLAGFAVVDTRIPVLSCAPIEQGTVLPVGGSTSCVGVYTTTQQDMNTGTSLVNVASVSGGGVVVLANSTVQVRAVKSFQVTKSADRATVEEAGQKITYR